MEKQLQLSDIDKSFGYHHAEDRSANKTIEYMPKTIKSMHDVTPVAGYYIRTLNDGICRVIRLVKEPRKVFVEFHNAYNKMGQNYISHAYKLLRDVYVEGNNNGKIYDHCIYNENIIYQSPFIIDCFCNGDIVKLKNGKEVKVIGYKRGTIRQREKYQNFNGIPIKVKENYTSTLLYVNCHGRIIPVSNDQIKGLEHTIIDVDLLQGGDVVITAKQGYCAVLGVTRNKVHIKQLYPDLDADLVEAFVYKSEIIGIEYMQIEAEQ